MNRFKRISHTIWHCEYHIVWVPKYRYRVMQGKIKEEVESCVREQTRQMNSEVQELNVQAGHVHLVVQIPPKMSLSDYMGRLKGKSAIRVFSACASGVSGAITFGLKVTVLERLAWTLR